MYSEFLSENIRQRYQLADINYALRTIHFPLSMEELLVSRKRLVFDEFLLFILSIQMMKEKNEETPNYFPIQKTWVTEQIIENLPYSLTNAQLNTWHEIERDMSGQALMSRLIQGEVGSGKTIIAFLAMILSCENGYQSALMVPTEVLARQHYESFMELLAQQGLDFCTVLLTGSNTAKEKREIYAKIASGEAQIIIGTHALIQEKVVYKNLSLVITDEQHRFGVKQRESLAERGNPPNVLVMSATPIPRTLAIILYGDLDISVIDELPARRLPIKNCVVDTSYRPKAYSFIQRQVQAKYNNRRIRMKTFDYSLVKDPQYFKDGRMDAHSDHTYYRDGDEAQEKETSFRYDLNGIWKFHYARNYGSAVPGFEKEEYCCKDWDDIRVPAHIQMEGYDAPQYANVQYPWEGHEDIHPGEIPEHFNPVASYVKYFEVPEEMQGKRLFISFQGAESGIALWLNGHFVGYSEDSFTPSEFELTEYVK